MTRTCHDQPCFTPVISDRQVARVACLAHEIWTQHYTPIIGAAQVRYMLGKYQSIQAIAAQIQHEVYEYFLIEMKQSAVGYLALQPRDEELFLSKLYISSRERGRGVGRRAIAFVEEKAGEYGLPAISLTVNKDNSGTIRIYEKCGFDKVEPIVIDIGNGYVMDDYRMRKVISP